VFLREEEVPAVQSTASIAPHQALAAALRTPKARSTRLSSSGLTVAVKTEMRANVMTRGSAPTSEQDTPDRAAEVMMWSRHHNARSGTTRQRRRMSAPEGTIRPHQAGDPCPRARNGSSCNGRPKLGQQFLGCSIIRGAAEIESKHERLNSDDHWLR